MAPSMTTSSPHQIHSCPNCGLNLSSSYFLPSPESSEAESRTRDLEAQVKLLNSKAAAAVDKLADYEDEIRFLRSQGHISSNNGFMSPPPDEVSRPQTAPYQKQAQPFPSQSRIASLSSFWTGRKSSNPNISRTATSDPSMPPVPPTPYYLTAQFPQQSPGLFTTFSNASTPNLIHSSPPQPPPPPDPNLTAALEAERQARARAEQTLSQTQSELEDLTAKLFGEANEMVATERRARAKLEERVRLLEKRDGEKRRRLERLEGAMQRIERVRTMVG